MRAPRRGAHARRDDEEDIVSRVLHEEMIGDLEFDVTLSNPRSGEVEYQSLNGQPSKSKVKDFLSRDLRCSR
jgi:hypothetical protein